MPDSGLHLAASVQESRRLLYEQVTEKVFRAQLLSMATLYGWEGYFTWLSIRSAPGFPDLVLVKGERIVIAELKVEKLSKGKLTEKQARWLLAWWRTGKASVFVWRPSYMWQAQETLAA